MSKLFVFVLLPTSLVADAPNLQQKTMKIGMVGRSLAIFRVDKAVLYNDDDPRIKNQAAEAEAVATLLRYIETPQYLRRLLFPRERNLRFAGILPPLRTPHHPLRDERTNPGDYREAAVIKVDELGSLLEIGLREKGFTSERLRVGQRLTVRLGDRLGEDRMAVTQVARGRVEEYWGYDVSLARSLADALKSLKADYVIGTSRYGKNLYEALRGIGDSKPRSVAVAFGGPYQGLFEICERQGVDAGELFDVVINTIPQQGTETVRTEEALMATLALLNASIWGK
ncbi:MAG: RNA methyltransferase [Candidatus Hodarchaeaceae archaeon]|nr:RNA methyltransferase [Candidatus Hodarchaeaceae archaeon]